MSSSAGIKRVVNGPIPYSPDGLPYLGPAHGLTNFFHCNTFSFGITQAGGAGKACAEWVVAGGPEWDLWALDPRRFTGYATKSYALARAVEVYENEYAPAFPFEERRAGRPLRCSSLHARLAAAGAQFGVRRLGAGAVVCGHARPRRRDSLLPAKARVVAGGGAGSCGGAQPCRHPRPAGLHQVPGRGTSGAGVPG